LSGLNVTSGILEKFAEYDGLVLHIEAIEVFAIHPSANCISAYFRHVTHGTPDSLDSLSIPVCQELFVTHGLFFGSAGKHSEVFLVFAQQLADGIVNDFRH
jgi:hypothetical protein